MYQANRLHRSLRDKIVGGVCGGLAETWGADPTLIRLLFFIFILLAGSGLIVYIVLWIIMPLE